MYSTRRCLVKLLPQIQGFYWLQCPHWLWTVSSRIVWQTTPYSLFFSDVSGAFFRLFSSFNDKQGPSITKTKTALVRVLMFNNQEKVNWPLLSSHCYQTIIIWIYICILSTNFEWRYTHFKSFSPSLISCCDQPTCL